jgi:glycosyltransferase involved in cell wall biosynthesis
MNYSVLTACLNSAGTIGRSIESVMMQDPRPSQYVFVDGMSSDGTPDVIRDTLRKGSYTDYKVVVQRDKSGITGAWNLGLPEITGDAVFILNSDDWYERGAATSVLEAFSSMPDIGIVLSSAYFHIGGANYTAEPKSFSLLPILMPVIHPGCFVRKDVYEKVGPFDCRSGISADYDFIYRCHNARVKFHQIRQPLVNMQLGGIANSSRARARKETLEIALRHSGKKLLPYLAFWTRALLGR